MNNKNQELNSRIDYKELLIKYIKYVGLSEGINFIDFPDEIIKELVEFTKEEWDKLEKISESVKEQ